MAGEQCMEHSGVCAKIDAIEQDIADNVKPEIKAIKEEIHSLTRHVYYAAGALGLALVLIEKVWK
jgi:phytoene/squalene synthetase